MTKYENYKMNLVALRAAQGRDIQDDLIVSGVIWKFLLQFELAWKLLQKTLQYEGQAQASSGSPRSIIKLAYSTYDFIDADIWLRMLSDRNSALHVYDSELATRLVKVILSDYLLAFDDLLENIESLYGEDLLKSF